MHLEDALSELTYVFTNADSCSSAVILNKELVAKEHSTIYS